MRTIGIAGAILAIAMCARAGAAAPPASAWRIIHDVDTNGDGMADVIWANDTTQKAAVWLMQGTRVLAAGAPFSAPAGGGWTAIAAEDFNGDGLADVFWSNAATSRLSVSLLEGARLLAQGPPVHGPPGEGWAVGAAGDTNGDRMADAFWYSSSRHAAAVWLMNGTRLLAAGPELAEPPDTGWTVSNVADMNGDGLADIVWNDTPPDRLCVWLMAGTRVLARGPELQGPVGADWKAVTTGDLDADGMNDVVWTRPGRMQIWLMNGTQVRAIGPEITGPGDDWEVAGVGDTNGDHMADAVWQKMGESRMAVWLMNGAQVLAAGPEIAGPR